ncbi:MAG: peptidylprolyl isomerase [Allosphingosinicella sp.]
MKLARFPRAAIVLAVPLLSAMAAAQAGQSAQVAPAGRLNIPQDVQVVAAPNTNLRKATAIVNGDVLTETDIDHRLALYLRDLQTEIPPDEIQRFRARVLRDLIDETLQIQAAAQEEITVTDAEVDQYYARVAQDNNQTPQALSAYLRTIGSSERSMKRQIRGQLAWQRLRGRWIEPFVSVGDDEVAEIITRMNASRGMNEYRVGEIYISSTPETAAEARINADRIVQQIRGGAPFQAYARQFSEASTAAVGGDLGWVRAEQLPAELNAIVTRMPSGAISDPVEVPGGYSIVYLIDTRQVLMTDPRDAVLSLMQMSINLPPNVSEAQANARARQLAEATQGMGGCGGAAAAAQAIGADLVTNDQVRPREDLPPQLHPMVLNLNVGEVTAPFGSTERVSVLVLCGRDDPTQAGTPSAVEIENRLREERGNRRAQRYLRDLRRDAVIDYR